MKLRNRWLIQLAAGAANLVLRIWMGTVCTRIKETSHLAQRTACRAAWGGAYRKRPMRARRNELCRPLYL